MAQQTKRFSQQLLAGWQKGAWRGHETNPKSKSVPLLLLLLLRYLAVCPMSCVIVLPLLLVLGNSVVSFICARIDFYATFFSFSSHSLSLSQLLGFALVGFSTHTIENSIDLQNEVAFGQPLRTVFSPSLSHFRHPYPFLSFSWFFIYFHFGFYERNNNFWAVLGFCLKQALTVAAHFVGRLYSRAEGGGGVRRV